MIDLRWATAEDNLQLIELVRACPVRGKMEFYIDRSPDFFALSRIQGEGTRVCVGVKEGQIIAAMAIALWPNVYVNGEPRPAFYIGDLRIHPDHRGQKVVQSLHRYLYEWIEPQGWDLGLMTVLADNRAMDGVLRGMFEVTPFYPLATMRNEAVYRLFRKWAVKDIEVRVATPSDRPEMVELWNRLQKNKQFAPVWDENRLTGSLNLSQGQDEEKSYLLAYREGRLTGLMTLWDQREMKRLVLVDYGDEMKRFAHWYNPLASVCGFAKLPPRGQALPYCYATNLCAETSRDLEALLVAAHNQSTELLFFNALLDQRDPLLSAFRRFPSQGMDIRLMAVDPFRKWSESSFRSGPVYFDPCVV